MQALTPQAIITLVIVAAVFGVIFFIWSYCMYERWCSLQEYMHDPERKHAQRQMEIMSRGDTINPI